jgi:hypothetical protein
VSPDSFHSDDLARFVNFGIEELSVGDAKTFERGLHTGQVIVQHEVVLGKLGQ